MCVVTTVLAGCAAAGDLEVSARQRARAATLAAFFVQGAIFATWVSRIPLVQERLGLSHRGLGAALLALSGAGMVSMPLTGAIVARVGARRAARVAVVGYGMALMLPAVAGSFWQLVGALVALGAMFGAMNISINAQAVVVEKAYGRPIMSTFHAFYSLGGMVGAAVGGVLAGAGVPMAGHFFGVAVVLVGVMLGMVGWMLPEGAARAEEGRTVSARGAFFQPGLLLLGAAAFCVLVGEGAMADWTAVYLHRELKTGEGFAAAGFAAFSLAMTGGRLVADRVTAKLGAVRFIQVGGTVAAAGLAAGLMSHVPGVALAGFACAGAGFSGIVPILFSAAGRTAGVASSVGIAAVSTMGFVGFLLGPPLIGLVADATTLGWGLGIVVVTSGMAAVMGRWVGRGK